MLWRNPKENILFGILEASKKYPKETNIFGKILYYQIYPKEKNTVVILLVTSQSLPCHNDNPENIILRNIGVIRIICSYLACKL